MKKSLINPHAAKKAFNRRALLLLLGLVLFALLIALRLFMLQILEHKRYTTLSTKNLLTLIPIAPKRGLIYDRDGTLIASNKTSFRVSIIPERTPHMKATLVYLQHLLGTSPSLGKQVLWRLHRHRPYEHVPYLNKLTPKQLSLLSVNAYRLPGVVIDPDLKRQYPLKNIFAAPIGYMTHLSLKHIPAAQRTNYSATSSIGSAGIEKSDEQLLHGHVGAQAIEIDASGHTVRSLTHLAPTPGQDLILTLSTALQKTAMQALGKETGAVVALDPNNGAVLAMASTPSFDPNWFINGFSKAAYQQVFAAKQSPLFNLADHGQFAIGSTIKPFYALMALDQHVISPQDAIFDRGWFQIPNTKHIYHDWKLSGHGWVNVSKAIMVSCDTYFYHLATLLSIYSMDNILQQFGFGKATGVGLSNERCGVIPSPHWKQKNIGRPWYTGDKILTIIGQGFLLATPLQLANATQFLANKGVAYRPHLIQARINPQGQIITTSPVAEPTVHLTHPENWHVVQAAMQQVILNPEGTGEHFGHPPYTVAAKTGTTQLYGHNRDEERSRTNIPKHLRNNHLFIAYAPVNHPRIVVAVIVEHAAQAASVARKVMDRAWLLTHHFQTDVPTRAKKLVHPVSIVSSAHLSKETLALTTLKTHSPG